MSDFLLSQILAASAFACGVISFQSKTRRSILLWLCGTALANACHFFILAELASATLFLINGFRCLVGAFSVNRKIMYIFLCLISGGFLYMYKTPLEFLGLFAALAATYGSFQKTEQQVRIFHMLSNVSWMVHNSVVWTPVAALMEGTFLISNVLGYWRFHRRV